MAAPKLDKMDKSDKVAKSPIPQTAVHETHQRKVRVDKKRLASQHGHRVGTQMRIIRYGLRNFSRNVWLTIAATVMMIVPLLIIFMTVVASSVFNEIIESQNAKIDISIYFKSNTSDDTLANLAGKLRIIPNVASVDISDSANEYQNLQNQNENNQAYMNALSTVVSNGVNVQLSAVIHVKLKNPEDQSAVNKLIATDPQFQQWLDKTRMESNDNAIAQNTVKRLTSIMNFVQRIGFGLAAVFVAISILIIFNTIQMAIFSRREEIDMEKAIGADRKFIRGPFLVEAELYGVIAAVIATALGYLIAVKALPALSTYVETSNTQTMLAQWFWPILIGMVLLGIIIGDISARLAVRRYLKP